MKMDEAETGNDIMFYEVQYSPYCMSELCDITHFLSQLIALNSSGAGVRPHGVPLFSFVI